MEPSNTRSIVDNFYVNVDLYNGQTDANTLPIDIRAEQTMNYNVPLIDDPGKYTVALEKASIPMRRIPLFRLSGKNLQMKLVTNTTTSIYDYRIGQGIFGTADDEIYYVHQLLGQMNSDSVAHYVKLGLTVANAPYFLYNPTLQLFEAHFPSELEYARSVISFSKDLRRMFDGFLFEDTPMSMWCVFKPATKDVVRGTKDGFGHIVLTQEFPSIGNWSDVDTILVTTTLPVVPEAISSFDPDSASNSSLTILTDLSINTGSVMSSRGDVSLVPNYRREINLLQGSSIYSFKIKFWYRTKKGQVYELMVPYDGRMMAKLVFRRNR